MFKILGEKDMELKVTMPEHITAEEMALEAKKQVAIELFKTGDYSLVFVRMLLKFHTVILYNCLEKTRYHILPSQKKS